MDKFVLNHLGVLFNCRVQGEIKRLQGAAGKVKQNDKRVKKKATKVMAKSQKQRHELLNHEPYPLDNFSGNTGAAQSLSVQTSIEDTQRYTAGPSGDLELLSRETNHTLISQADMLDAEVQPTPQTIESVCAPDVQMQPSRMHTVLTATSTSSSSNSTDGESDDHAYVDVET